MIIFNLCFKKILKRLKKKESVSNFIGFLPLLICLSGQNDNSFNMVSNQVSIKWVETLDGDFSFKDDWNYPKDIKKNKYGQLICDVCNDVALRMLDSNFQIKKDSLESYYKIVDTTHRFNSINSKSNHTLFFGENFINVKQKSYDSIFCFTEFNCATFCQLRLFIVKNKCQPMIYEQLNEPGSELIYCNGGEIKIDKNLWKKGIMKAEFNFHFKQKNISNDKVYWKGEIYAPIEK